MAATFLRKFATMVSGVNIISIPLVKAGVTNFAVSADWTPVAGDVVIARDSGVFANITTLPQAKTAGNAAVWDFYLSATELTSKQTRVMISDAATKAIEDDYFIIETYGNSGAMHSIDYEAVKQNQAGYLYADVAYWSGTVLPNQTTAGIPDINVKNILGTASQGVAGYMAPDWSHVNAPTTSVNLSNTSISGILSYSGNTPQTGDSFARIGGNGINLTSIVASSVLGNVGGSVLGNLNGSINGSISGNIIGNVLGNMSGTLATVTNLTNLPAISTNWLTAAGLADDAAVEIAHLVLKKSVSGIQDTAEEHSLATVILQSTESSISSNTLTIRKTDGTTYLTKTLTKTAGDAPIRGIT